MALLIERSKHRPTSEKWMGVVNTDAEIARIMNRRNRALNSRKRDKTLTEANVARIRKIAERKLAAALLELLQGAA